MQRRNFLGGLAGILAAGSAPAIIHDAMKIFVPKNEIILPELDLAFTPDLSEWVSNQAYVRRNIIPRTIEAPQGFKLLPEPDYWVETMKKLVDDAEYSAILAKVPRLSREQIEWRYP